MASANTNLLGGVKSGDLTATGASETFLNAGKDFNVSVRGTFVGTVTLDRSFDGGSNWFVCSSDSAGTAASWTAPFSVVVSDREENTLYRLSFTRTSGTVTYRISQ